MFDVDRAGSVFAAVSPPVDVAASPVEPPGAPLERLEAQICELAGHLAAATCRFLVLLADFDARRADLHHIVHRVNGGRTDLDNLISLCPYHHKLVHDRGYAIAGPPGGAEFAFYRPDGTPLPASPSLPEPGGPIGQAHDADIAPDTIIPGQAGHRRRLPHLRPPRRPRQHGLLVAPPVPPPARCGPDLPVILDN
jgi:HNH endonuclease